ncbi:MAG: ShlB/FhaC/HecB family hemolysin secretion/activation protein [Gammaproteobacteria bacterium]|nr:ShlB/FhaC/HecB family hemolysin secretion/activation protein [Gammaproteobacteria bacterium]
MRVSTIVALSLGVFFSHAALAVSVGVTPTDLPGSVLPERQSNALATQPEANPATLPPLGKQKNEQPASLGPAAASIKFKLVRINLQGEHVYTEAQLAALYKDKIGTTITVAELQQIVQDITNYYRNNGYILSRAVLPPQHVANGVVFIQVIEGYIDQVKVVGVPVGARSIVQGYGNKISQVRPLQLKKMEQYLLLANEVPGVQVKAVLEPSKTNVGASNLNLVAQTKTFSSYVSYDDYGTRYIGPQQISAGVEADSIFRSGDSTQLNVVNTTRGQELRFLELLHSTPLGLNGTRLTVSGNTALTQPEFVLAPLKINGTADTYSAIVSFPVIRSRTHNLSLDAGFNYVDSWVTSLQPSVQLYTDHLRTFRFGGNFDMSDSWHGNNGASLHVEQGLPILGATPESRAESGFVSRVGGSGHFTRMSTQLSRLQQFGASRYSAYVVMQAQYALEPLLATEQFAYGGAQQALGRGYDPAELIGDRGAAGSLELRMNLSPEKRYLQAAQLYAFYDIGVIWNLKNVVDQKRKQSAASAGVGSRFFFTKNVSGNLMIAQPITRQVSALELIGRGRRPRVFFSITASV